MWILVWAADTKLQLIQMLDIPDQNMKNEEFCSQLSTYFKRRMGFRSEKTFGLS
jgi:hypothetical protein